MAKPIVFALNGERVEVPAESVTAKTSLNEYLRTGPSQGTKLSCGQGGCGACTVAVAEWTEKGPVTRVITSCITPLVQVAGKSVTTVEGLCKGAGQHPIQARMGHYFASQCGFCTPGMVMQLYGTLAGTDGGKNASPEKIEKALESGNLCRCTGYRPIVDAGKSFCAGATTKTTTVVSESTAPGLEGPYDPACDPAFPEWLRQEPISLSATLGSTSQVYNKPDTLQTATAFLQKNPGCAMISGHTSVYVHDPMITDVTKPVLDLSAVKELHVMEIAAGAAQVKVGAAIPLEDFSKALEASGAEWVKPLVRHLGLIVGPQLRHHATVGGNIALSRMTNSGGHVFPSDLASPLMALDATVEEWKGGSMKSTPISQWMKEEAAPGSIIVAFSLKAPKGVFESYRVAQRPRACKADLCASFVVEVDGSGTVASARVAYGALGDKVPCRATATEQCLVGKKASALLKGMPSPLDDGLATAVEKDVKATGDLRQHLTKSLLTKFLAKLCAEAGSPVLADAAAMLHGETKVHSGTQTLPTVANLIPFGTAGCPKDKVNLQCNGQALFTDDVAIKRLKDSLQAAVVCCRVLPSSEIKSIAVPKELAELGATFYGKADVAVNQWEELGFPDRLFIGVGDMVEHWGDPCGVVAAPTVEAAKKAAEIMLQGIEFAAPTKPVVTSISDVRTMEKRGDDITDLVIKTQEGGRGNAAAAFQRARAGTKTVQGRFNKNGQHHWYMEVHTAFVEMDEGGSKYIVSSATQNANTVQQHVAGVLGLDMCRVEVKHRRCGGGFGGKASPSIKYAAMAALACKGTGKPVRICLPREVDSMLVGGRERWDIEYEMLLNERTGAIEAVKLDVLAGVGWRDCFGPMMLGSAVDGCYAIQALNVKVRSIKLASAHTEAVRGPGHHEAAVVIETILDHAAHALGRSPWEVREANFYRMGNPLRRLGMKFGLIPPLPVSDVDKIAKVFAATKSRARIAEREAAVAAFNREHETRKRGLGVCITKYGMIRFASHTSLVNIYADGSVLVHHDGSEIGQGLQTKALQMARRVLSTAVPEGLGPIPLELIRSADHNTDVVMTGGTGGSITSEMVCYSIEDACFKLLEKLAPAKKQLMKGALPATAEEAWKKMVALSKPLNPLEVAPYLGAVGRYAAGMDQLKYECYCSSVMEVEVDGLTGEYDMLHCNVLFEAGPYLHGGIEVGQIEGGFIMGVGALTTEKVMFDPATSELLSDNTWRYKIPNSYMVPKNFEVDLLNLTEESPMCDMWEVLFKVAGKFVSGEVARPTRSQRGPSARIKGAKATGEPPLCAAASVLPALRQAIAAFGSTEWVQLDPPVTVEQVAMLCAKARHGAPSSGSNGSAPAAANGNGEAPSRPLLG